MLILTPRYWPTLPSCVPQPITLDTVMPVTPMAAIVSRSMAKRSSLQMMDTPGQLVGAGGRSRRSPRQRNRLESRHVHRAAVLISAAVARRDRQEIGIGRGQAMLCDVEAHDLLLRRDPQAHSRVDELIYQEHHHQSIASNGDHPQTLDGQMGHAAAIKQALAGAEQPLRRWCPQIPFAQWTATAPTGSSTWSF